MGGVLVEPGHVVRIALAVNKFVVSDLPYHDFRFSLSPTADDIAKIFFTHCRLRKNNVFFVNASFIVYCADCTLLGLQAPLADCGGRHYRKSWTKNVLLIKYNERHTRLPPRCVFTGNTHIPRTWSPFTTARPFLIAYTYRAAGYRKPVQLLQ